MSITTHHTMQIFSLIIFATTTLVLQSNYCFCSIINSEYSTNGSLTGFFKPAVATRDRTPGDGSIGRDCGFGGELAVAPYSGLVAAGGKTLFKNGQGCGTCYEVKCTQNPACSGNPVTVTISDECTFCNSDTIDHFVLTEIAFGFLAKPGQADTLRRAEIIMVESQRVLCHYNKTSITFKVVNGSGPTNLALKVEYVNGDGDIGLVEIMPTKPQTWIPMQQLRGVIWEIRGQSIGNTQGPFNVRVTTTESKKSVVAQNVIPPKYVMGQRYVSNVNF